MAAKIRAITAKPDYQNAKFVGIFGNKHVSPLNKQLGIHWSS